MSKGSRRRPDDDAAYAAGYERIFGVKPVHPADIVWPNDEPWPHQSITQGLDYNPDGTTRWREEPQQDDRS